MCMLHREILKSRYGVNLRGLVLVLSFLLENSWCMILCFSPKAGTWCSIIFSTLLLFFVALWYWLFLIRPMMYWSINADDVITKYVSFRQHKIPDFLGGEERLVLHEISQLLQMILIWAYRQDSWMTLPQDVNWKHQHKVLDHIYRMQGSGSVMQSLIWFRFVLHRTRHVCSVCTILLINHHLSSWKRETKPPKNANGWIAYCQYTKQPRS